jgi:peptide/nickel transport system substrate-binding protein
MMRLVYVHPMTNVGVLLLAAVLSVSLPAHAGKTLRFASAFEPGSMDPHSVGTLYAARVQNQIFDMLVSRGESFAVEPALALSWSVVEPTVWRFKLRPGVKFHDGSPFGADDVVFSIERAMAPTSAVKGTVPNVKGVRKVDDLTVDVVTTSPTPVLPVALSGLRIMSKAWAVKYRAETPQNFQAKEDTHASRHAVGTGPYILKEWVPDVRTVLVANPNYWRARGNVEEARYLVMGQAATRLAALVSGEVDFVVDPAIQDIERLKGTAGIKVATGVGRSAQFLGFDQSRDRLLYGDAGDRNPFKELKVRQAVRLAIDKEALQVKIMRNLALSGSAMYSPAVEGYDRKFDRPSPYDPARARALLKEAGYPNGFAVTLHCSASQPADSLCQAVASMLSRVGIRVAYQPIPFNNLVPRLLQHDVSFYSVGWTPGTDAEGVLIPLAHSRNGTGDGQYNAGRYSNPKVDELLDQARVELDPPKRLRMLSDAMAAIDNDAAFVPLVYTRVYWAMRNNVHVIPRPNDVLELRFVNLD